MKECIKCGSTKSLKLFNNNGKYKRTICRTCENKRRSERKSNQYPKDGYYYVYYLPEEHYVGMTSQLDLRIYEHNVAGRITEGYVVIAIFERAIDAHALETMFHVRNYNGYDLYKN